MISILALRRSALGLVALALVPLALAGCAGQEPTPTFPPISFTSEAPITLDVQTVEVQDTYMPPLKRPNVEHEFPMTPASVLARWPAERIRPVGMGKTAVLIIKDASAVEEPLPTTSGIQGLFKTEQASRVTARIEATLAIRGADGRQAAFTTARVARSTTLPEGQSLNARDASLYQLNRDLMTAFDREMTQQINDYLTRYLR